MATKKAGSAKKTTRSKSQPAKTTKTTVTTVKAVETAKPKVSASRFGDRKTVLAAALIGEFIGTFLLATAFLVTKGEPLYMGFVLVALVLIVGTLSSAHFNPLLTIGAWVTRKIGNLRAVGYLIAQFLGAGAAFVLLSTYIGGISTESQSLMTQTPSVFELQPLSEQNHWFIFFAELLGAAIFAFAVAGAMRDKTDRLARAFTIGFGLFVAVLVAGVAAGYVSGQVAVNPALALAASAIDWAKIDWFAVAAYLAAPVIGGILGFVLRDVVETQE